MNLRRCASLLGALALMVPLASQSTRFVTILHLNDTHANVIAGAPRDAAMRPTVGGLARAAKVVARERRRGHPVLALHSGDFSMGDPTYNFFFGVPELQLLAAMGLDAMAVGNHEFDLTPMSLLGALVSASAATPLFPLLSANLDFSDPQVQALQAFVQPYVIRDLDGLRVGIFGMTTPETAVLSLPAPVVVSADVGLIAAQTVSTLQQAGCEVIVMLSHLGLAVDTAIAQGVPGIHLILGGHDHYELVMPTRVQGPLGETVTIVQTGGFYRQMGRMEVRWHKGKVEVRHAELLDLGPQVAEEPSFVAPVAALQQQVEMLFPGMYSQPVAYATATFAEKALRLQEPGRHDTPVGNLLADAMLAVGATDVAISPSGSTAQPLFVGPVAPADLFRTVGYGFNTTNGLGFRLVTCEMLGAVLMGGLEFTLANLPEDSDFFAQVSTGFQYRYDPAQPPGSRLLSATLNGNHLQPLTAYRVTLNEFTLAFLRDYLQLPIGNAQVLPVTEFEALLQYAAGQPTLSPLYATPRVIAVD